MEQRWAKISIPDDVRFADLRLARDDDGSVRFDWTVIERICAFNDLPVAIFHDGPEDNLAALIVSWYEAHRDRGGDADPVAESLIAEVLDEDRAGQPFSYRPGRA